MYFLRTFTPRNTEQVGSGWGGNVCALWGGVGGGWRKCRPGFGLGIWTPTQMSTYQSSYINVCSELGVGRAIASGSVSAEWETPHPPSHLYFCQGTWI